MSRSGEVILPFGGQDHTFRLTIRGWERVQERCDAGPPELARRLTIIGAEKPEGVDASQWLLRRLAAGHLGQWRVNDVREVILQGLLGGGSSGPEATTLVMEWVDNRPLLENVPLALDIVVASIAGPNDEQDDGSGEPPGEPLATNSPEENSGSPRSTDEARP